MPTSQHHHFSLQQQYHHLRRDWDHYKTSIPHHRRSRSAANLPSSAANVDSEGAFETAKEAEAAEIEYPLRSCDCFSSSSSSSLSSESSWNEYEDEGSSSDDNDDDDDDLGVRREKPEEWMERLRWFGIVMVAVVVGVFSFGVVFGAEDVGQLMTPT